MSNCIEFVRGSEKVVFFANEIDVAALKALVDSATEKDADPGQKDEAGVDRYFAWWFLKGSVIDYRGAVVVFGQCNSGHTNRDFDGTLSLLAKFMRKPKYHTFFITDEFDGHQHVYRAVVKFDKTLTINGETMEQRDARIMAKIKQTAIDYSKVKVRTLTPSGWVEGDDFATGLKTSP